MEADAVEVQRLDALRLFGRDLAADVGEVALPAEALDQILPLRLACSRRSASQSFATDRRFVVDRRRHGVDGVGVDAGRQHAPAAIEDVAALGGERLIVCIC